MVHDTEASDENKIIVIDENVEIIKCNAYRIDVSNNYLIMNFGKAKPLENGQTEVKVVAKIAIPLNDMYLAILLDYFQAGRDYENESGITLFPIYEEPEDEIEDYPD